MFTSDELRAAERRPRDKARLYDGTVFSSREMTDRRGSAVWRAALRRLGADLRARRPNAVIDAMRARVLHAPISASRGNFVWPEPEHWLAPSHAEAIEKIGVARGDVATRLYSCPSAAP